MSGGSGAPADRSAGAADPGSTGRQPAGAGVGSAGDELAGELLAIAREAGAAILAVYARADPDLRLKADRSPVTAADLAAEQLILARLAELAPDIPVVAEESVAAGRRPDVGTAPFFLVDPLDGTKEFLARNGEFTVNIALVRGGVPVAGVVHVPALGQSYVGGPAGATRLDGAGTRSIAVRAAPADGFDVLVSRSHLDAATEGFLAGLRVRDRVAAGSSLKFCRVAEGVADLYPRFGRTMWWDTAAGHAVLLAAGGAVVRADDGSPLRYAGTDLANPAFLGYGATPPSQRARPAR